MQPTPEVTGGGTKNTDDTTDIVTEAQAVEDQSTAEEPPAAETSEVEAPSE
ncbi:hypothetical protein A6P39_004310 [Streptomyces sp. FXJ1.172]|uniref:hypothetical protein n=1 Tax=Streptomyces sp. FXJ1.172 TaxID=710705 RepID=UPI0013314805|nr:hypothetical protein [Streptomyces sp. FXJ1.172]WEO93315.1 hypothetical protein A6P39_004310 [Streptomyces sp. FXJ1.172]